MAATLAAAGLPTADLARPGRHLFRFETTLGEPVGFGGWEGEGDDRLIRSIVVAPAYRRQRYGKAIASTLERLAGAHGARRLHLLTTDAAPFFEALGYGAADQHAAPAEIAATEEFAHLCPATARYLTKDVRTSW
ncbi:MAG TPA: arsenic resistance N-acetyltransferase ArsN2 [Aliidongia sp.]|nr:arsenic resistance N-acetyltransferase ArsN2 [Aliidongia sp.]